MAVVEGDSGVHGDFFTVVDHVIFMVTVQVYILATIIDFIVVIVLKSHFIFSYLFVRSSSGTCLNVH